LRRKYVAPTKQQVAGKAVNPGKAGKK